MITQIIHWELLHVMARASLHKFHVMTAKEVPQSLADYFYVIANPIHHTENI